MVPSLMNLSVNLKSMNRRHSKRSGLGDEADRPRFQMSHALWVWLAGGASGVALASLLMWGRLPLALAAVSSLASAAIVVLATMRNRPKLMLMFLLNACVLVVPRRDVDGVDFIVLLSLLIALITAFGLVANKRTVDATVTTTPVDSNFGAVQFMLVGFVTWSVVSTLSNSQNLLSLMPWLNGVTLAFLVSCAPSSQLPSFSSVRRAVLVGGALAVTYDLYLLGTGRALNVGTFNAGRFVGSLGDYELVAEFYGAIILLCFTAVLFDSSGKWRIASAALVLPSFILLLATQSRGPVIILSAVLPLLSLTSAFLFRESVRKIVGVAGALVVAVLASIGTLSTLPLFTRLSSIQLDGGIESTLNRASVWDYFTQLPRFVQSGLVGNGFDYPYEQIGTFPHSLYLWLLWSGGVVALTFFGLLALLLMFKLFRGITLRRSASLSAAAIVVYILVDEIKIEAARTSPSVCFLWVVLSLAILASREQREL
jgi:hypothetical protein